MATTDPAHAPEGDERDGIANQRDLDADLRDAVADQRDAVADAREDQLRMWERQLEARARRLRLATGEALSPSTLAAAAAERDAAATERAARASERDAAAAARRAEARHDTLLAGAFAGIAEYLHESDSPEQLLARVAEVAVSTIAGTSRATVRPDTRQVEGTEPASESACSGQPAWSMSFTLDAPEEAGAQPPTLSLTIFSDDPVAVDRAAENLGMILAAHASLAARSLTERARLERLQQALTSRDVIGRAKGMLEERLKITSDEAFELLKRSSQLLNVKLREVAQTLTETGEIPSSGPTKR